MDRITGEVKGVGYVSGSISQFCVISGNVVLPKTIRPDIYEGAYIVIPKLTEQTLSTKYKNMADDVTVKEIPVTYTSNPYGGQTVLIG